MTDVIRMNDLPKSRQIRIVVPQIDATGSMSQHCTLCKKSMFGEKIAAVVIYSEEGAERSGPWMHVDCAEDVYEAWLRDDLKKYNVVVVTGTQKEFLAIVHSSELTPVVVNYTYTRGKAVRYCWSVLNGTTLEKVVLTVAGDSK